MAAVANGRGGIFIFNGATNTSVTGNLLSGNAFDGISIQGVFGTAVAAHDNQVTGNLIGTNASGTAPVPNVFAGVRLTGDNNVIGGSAGAANVIAFNNDDGVTATAGASFCPNRS